MLATDCKVNLQGTCKAEIISVIDLVVYLMRLSVGHVAKDTGLAPTQLSNPAYFQIVNKTKSAWPKCAAIIVKSETAASEPDSAAPVRSWESAETFIKHSPSADKTEIMRRHSSPGVLGGRGCATGCRVVCPNTIYRFKDARRLGLDANKR